VLAHLRATRTHPTAAQIHAALTKQWPALALATVYRNLEILVAEGLVGEVPTTAGALRYDGNLAPHDHFDCERCGRLLDLPSGALAGVARRLARRHDLEIRRVRITLVGACPDCVAARAARPTTRRARPRGGRASNVASDIQVASNSKKEGTRWPI